MSEYGKRDDAARRRRAAIHEAGHVVVAEHFDIQVRSAYIEPCISRSRSYTWPDWRGAVGFYHEIEHAPNPVLQMVAVAGAVAERCWLGLEDPCVDHSEMSPEDIASAEWTNRPLCYGDPDLESACIAVWGLLNRDDGPLWRALCREAHDLISRHRS